MNERRRVARFGVVGLLASSSVLASCALAPGIDLPYGSGGTSHGAGGGISIGTGGHPGMGGDPESPAGDATSRSVEAEAATEAQGGSRGEPSEGGAGGAEPE